MDKIRAARLGRGTFSPAETVRFRMIAACMDPRLFSAFLQSAGTSVGESEAFSGLLCAMMSGDSPARASALLKLPDAREGLPITLELCWDCVRIGAQEGISGALDHALAKFSESANPEVAQSALQATAQVIEHLDAALQTGGMARGAVLGRRAELDAAAVSTLIDVWRTCADRLVQSEIALMFTRKIRSGEARLRAGEFVACVLAVPAPRTQRFVLCEALENLAQPELAPAIARAIREHPEDSLRGRWCTALARCGAPEFAEPIADVVRTSHEETLIRSIQALADLGATQYAGLICEFCEYRCADKEWTKAVRKTAEKGIKKLK